MSGKPVTIRDRFDPRRNNLGPLRLVFAGAVLIVHAQALVTGTNPRIGRSDLGQMAVDAFFVVSGFLIARSAMQLGRVRRFLWHRALRILPGFWACLVVTAFVVAPLLAVIEGSSARAVFTGQNAAWRYVLGNLALLIRQYKLGELRQDGVEPGVLNGSLWSLYYEAVCYLIVAGLAVAGALRVRRRGGAHVLRRRPGGAEGPAGSGGPRAGTARGRLLVLALTAALWATLVADKLGVTLPKSLGRLMVFMFLLGVLAHLFADRIPLRPDAAAGATALWLGSCLLMLEYQLVGGVAFAYLLVWLAAAAPVVPQPRVDLSYGVYLYHWPVLTVLLELGLAEAGRAVLVLCTVAVTSVLAWGAWHLVESRALRFKHARWVCPRTRGDAAPLPPSPYLAAAQPYVITPGIGSRGGASRREPTHP